MTRFVEISQPLYRKMTPLGDERTDLYRANNPVLRWLFWERLRQVTRLIDESGVRGSCLDFGGGSGVMLPTLSCHFAHVCCMDLDAHLAKGIVNQLGLVNVDIVEANVANEDTKRYNAIVAADVLEHFSDLAMPIDALQRRLISGGWLFTSLPTETWLYETIRFFMRKQKPADHYHTAYTVEDYLQNNGFVRVLHRSIPIPFFAPLFLISGWRYSGKP